MLNSTIEIYSKNRSKHPNHLQETRVDTGHKKIIFYSHIAKGQLTIYENTDGDAFLKTRRAPTKPYLHCV